MKSLKVFPIIVVFASCFLSFVGAQTQIMSSAAHVDMGKYWRERRGFTRAQEEFESAIQVSADNAEAHYQLAMLLTDIIGDHNAAATEFQHAINFDPNHAAAHYAFGVLLQEKFGAAGPAAQEYQTTITINPLYWPLNADARTRLANLNPKSVLAAFANVNMPDESPLIDPSYVPSNDVNDCAYLRMKLGSGAQPVCELSGGTGVGAPPQTISKINFNSAAFPFRLTGSVNLSCFAGSAVQELNFEYNSLTAVGNISGSIVNTVNWGANMLTSFNFRCLCGSIVEEVNLHSNAIAAAHFAELSCTEVKRLFLNVNKLGQTGFDLSDLQNNSKLEVLSLAYNRLQDINVAALGPHSGLTTLYLNGNWLWYAIDLAGLQHLQLQEIYLSGNTQLSALARGRILQDAHGTNTRVFV